VYQSVPRAEIIDAIVHLNDLHRQARPANERELRAYERREAAAKTLLSNLPRTKEHPTLNTLLEIAEIFSLTIEGAHRLFGYDLANLRNYDLHLNGGRTHMHRLHEGLSAAEADGPLGAGYIRGTCKCEGSQRWPHHMRHTEYLSFEIRFGSSPCRTREGRITRRGRTAFARHWHLHRL
jgi:hypothetical protein